MVKVSEATALALIASALCCSPPVFLRKLSVLKRTDANCHLRRAGQAFNRLVSRIIFTSISPTQPMATDCESKPPSETLVLRRFNWDEWFLQNEPTPT